MGAAPVEMPHGEEATSVVQQALAREWKACGLLVPSVRNGSHGRRPSRRRSACAREWEAAVALNAGPMEVRTYSFERLLPASLHDRSRGHSQRTAHVLLCAVRSNLNRHCNRRAPFSPRCRAQARHSCLRRAVQTAVHHATCEKKRGPNTSSHAFLPQQQPSHPDGSAR